MSKGITSYGATGDCRLYPGGAVKELFQGSQDRLGYSQAAVTIQIKQLEQELNVHLFDRIGKQTTLTHQGALFYEHAVSVMKELEHARDAVTHVSELTGSLCLGTIESICATIFPELLRDTTGSTPRST